MAAEKVILKIALTIMPLVIIHQGMSGIGETFKEIGKERALEFERKRIKKEISLKAKNDERDYFEEIKKKEAERRSSNVIKCEWKPMPNAGNLEVCSRAKNTMSNDHKD